jgi:hypothetical protein
MSDALTAEEREKAPIQYGGRERKRAILKQQIEGAKKYAHMAEFRLVIVALDHLLYSYF